MRLKRIRAGEYTAEVSGLLVTIERQWGGGWRVVLPWGKAGLPANLPGIGPEPSLAEVRDCLEGTNERGEFLEPADPSWRPLWRTRYAKHFATLET